MPWELEFSVPFLLPGDETVETARQLIGASALSCDVEVIGADLYRLHFRGQRRDVEELVSFIAQGIKDSRRLMGTVHPALPRGTYPERAELSAFLRARAEVHALTQGRLRALPPAREDGPAPG